MNRNYLKGRRLEYAVMKYLKAKGFKCLRTAGSHGEFDIVAYDPSHSCVIFIQCKAMDRPNKKREPWVYEATTLLTKTLYKDYKQDIDELVQFLKRKS